ncbi:MAG: arginine--tRNA ligase, partial [Oscillospiraceae bacterium]|nr:arginine--tRNA ligase [Oscillospiraceae bacterium]
MMPDDPVLSAQLSARRIIEGAVLAAMEEGELTKAELPAFTVEIPADTAHGDFASNIAMAGAKAFSAPPRKIASAILARMDFATSCFLRAEIAGPGFLNLFLRPEWFAGAVTAILEKGACFGDTDMGKGKKVMVEFVSANPTGPMHMGN